jgi:rRNA maturation endonuclease Nob1
VTGKRKKKRCPICDAELDEDADMCSECGSYVEEPAYDVMEDEDEE